LDTVYGTTAFEVSIAKQYQVDNSSAVTDLSDDTNWFAPAADSSRIYDLGPNLQALLAANNPASIGYAYHYGDLTEAWRKTGTEWMKGTSFTCPLPLDQDVVQVSRVNNDQEELYLATVAKDTIYYFRVRAVNLESGRISAWNGINQEGNAVTTTATSAIDVVQNAFNTANFIDGSITARKIFVDSLAAITANMGIITDGALEGNENNYWALSDIVGPDGSISRYAGDFQVGTPAGDYLRCIYVPATGNYHIEFKASSFAITALGTEITGGFLVKKADGTTMFHITANGTKVKTPFTVTKPNETEVLNVTPDGADVTGSLSVKQADGTVSLNVTSAGTKVLSPFSVIGTDGNAVMNVESGEMKITGGFAVKNSAGTVFLEVTPEGKIKGVLGEFTYLVDSDQALANWANNERRSNQDYTSVLIASGTWNSNKQVNLTTSATKVVVGMPGSKLLFASTYGLRYDTRPTTTDYRMEGVNVELNYSSNAQIYAFYNCTNLTNCTSTATSTNNPTGCGFYNCTNLINCTGKSPVFIYAFYNCTNLTNCTGDASSYRDNKGYAFYNCTYLTNCTGTATGIKSGSYSAYGYAFSNCTNLTNCTGTTIGSGIAFIDCTNLTNCTGTATGSDIGENTGRGFYNCTNLTNCTGTSTGNSDSTGFAYCTNLTNCTGTANTTSPSASINFVRAFDMCKKLTNCTGTATHANTDKSGVAFEACENVTNCTGTGKGGFGSSTTFGSYGFFGCRGMLLNRPGSASTTSTYKSCYVSISASGAAPDDTAAGGWNKVNV
jgi:hypothetical protein